RGVAGTPVFSHLDGHTPLEGTAAQEHDRNHDHRDGSKSGPDLLGRVGPDDGRVRDEHGEEDEVDEGEEDGPPEEAADGGGGILAVRTAGYEQQPRVEPGNERHDDDTEEAEQPGERTRVAHDEPLRDRERSREREYRDEEAARPPREEVGRASEA